MTDPTPTRDEAPDALAKQITAAASDMCEIARIASEWRNGPKQSLTAIREIRAVLASAPAPASGRVDAGLPGPNKQLDRVRIGEGEYVRADEAIKTVMELQRQLYDADKRLASLSPAETPVSEAGGERLLRQLRALAVALHAKHYATDAPDWQPLEDGEGILSQIDNMTTGLVRADPVKCNCVRETFAYYLAEAENGLCKIPRRAADDLLQSYVAMEAIVAALAKPASSPAGGDVVEAHATKALMKAIQRAEDGAGTISAKEAVKLRPADWHAVCDRARKLAALSQSTSAGRVGE